MLDNYIQAPYINLPIGKATPALIITVVYVVVLAVSSYYGSKNEILKVNFIKYSRLDKGSKNKIILSVIGYVVLIFLCILLSRFLDEKNLFMIVAHTYLQYEVLVFLAVLIFYSTTFLNNVNRDTHIKVSNRILHYIIWVSVGAGLLSGQIECTLWQNVVVLISGGILNILFLLIDIKCIMNHTTCEPKFDLIPYSPVKRFDDLFPQHREQAEIIANIIYSLSPEPFSICLSGTWGSGKTSVINGVSEILEKREDKLYDFIHINALELDNKQTMLSYLMVQIKEKLKNHGVYVGIDSEYKEFVSSTAGKLTFTAIENFIQKKLSKGDDDYRQQKRQLEEVLKRTYQDGKLIVIVDDIERCDRKIARDYLFLIKEIATMTNCVSIFVTDYDILNKVVLDENVSEKSTDFLDKFFNYRMDLIDEDPENIFAFYDKYFNLEDRAFWSIYKIIPESPGTWYRNAIFALDHKINSLTKQKQTIGHSEEAIDSLKKRTRRQQEIRLLFTKLMKNSRNVGKFYNVFREHILYYEEHFINFPREVFDKYNSSRNIGQVLYLLSFTEVCMPSQYQQLIKNGVDYAFPSFYNVNTIDDIERRLLVELAYGLIFGEYSEFQETTVYIRDDIRRFIEIFLYKKSNLCDAVNIYLTQEEEWIDVIKSRNVEKIRKHWDEIIRLILQKSPSDTLETTNAWRNKTFAFLLDFAKQQIEMGEWSTDKIFSIFDVDSHYDRFWAMGTGLMQTFWKHLISCNIYTKPSKKIIDELQVFSHHYVYARVGSIYRLAHYLIPPNDNYSKTEHIQESLLDSNKKFCDNISIFLNKFEQVLPDFSFSQKGWYEKLKELVTVIEQYLKNKGIADYWDVKTDIEHMNDTAEELRCFGQIVAWVQGGESMDLGNRFSDIKANDIDKIIQYFDNVFSTQSVEDTKITNACQEFASFFKQIHNNQKFTISDKQVKNLHELVSKYVSLTGYSSLPYRRTLIYLLQEK